MGLKFHCGRALMFHEWGGVGGARGGMLFHRRKYPRVAELFLTNRDMSN